MLSIWSGPKFGRVGMGSLVTAKHTYVVDRFKSTCTKGR